MSKLRQSHQKCYRRQLQLETLEKRCMLALTAFVDVGDEVNCCPPAEVEIVAVAKPVLDSGDFEDEGWSLLAVDDVKLPVEETVVDIDVAPIERIYTLYAMEVAEVCEPTTDDVLPEDAEDLSDLIFTTTLFEDVQRNIDSEPVDAPLESEREATIDAVLDDAPVIYTMSPLEDTKAPANDEVAEVSPTKPQEQPAEVPVIYTFGGSTSGGPTTPNPVSPVIFTPSFYYAGRSVAQSAMSPNRKVAPDNLVTALTGASSKAAAPVNTTVAAPVATSTDQQPQPAIVDIAMPGSNVALKQLANGRIANRRR